MWSISGPFDGKVTGDVAFAKVKLLKTGKRYQLGRKEGASPLVVNNKRISKNHGEFAVAQFSQDDVLDTNARPKLEYWNAKTDRAIVLHRAGDTADVGNINPGATEELGDGDVVFIVNSLPLTVRWEALSVCIGKESVDLAACAELGINVTHTPVPQTTHHLIPSYALTPRICTSLLSLASFVKKDWLVEMLRLGDLGTDEGLEWEFRLPLSNVKTYRPAFSPGLPSALKRQGVWDGDEERVGMFRSFTFVFISQPLTELAAVIERGEGKIHVLGKDRAKGLGRLVGKIRKEGRKVVCVGDGKEGDEHVQRENLKFIPPEKILQAVAHVDTSYIESVFEDGDDAHRSSSPLPDFVPNTIPEELSIASEGYSAPKSKLVRRAGSRQPEKDVLDIDADVDDVVMAPPRKPLLRRTKGAKSVAIDNESDVFMEGSGSGGGGEKDGSTGRLGTSTSEERVVSSLDFDAPIPVRSSRLKRRAGTAALSQVTQSQAVGEMGEPPSKKFKQLFEESDPDMAAGAGFGGESLSSGSGGRETQPSLTQGEGGMGQGSRESRLDVVQEEEEESSGLGSLDVGVGEKRKAASMEEGDENIEMSDAVVAKKRAIEDVNAVQPSTTAPEQAGLKIRKSGAAPGKPDTDAAFLKALASTKRGKKAEDQFDRQFNQLKISKPELEREEREESWAVLGDFGDDRNMRGNFMVVVEMEVLRRDNMRGGREVGVEWRGRPNFKKFKKKIVGGRQAAVELIPSEENDYGMGSVYWKGAHSQSQSQSQMYNDTLKAPAPRQTQLSAKAKVDIQTPPRKGKGRAVVVDSDEEEVIEQVVPRTSRPAPSQIETQPQPRTATRSARTREKPQPLFLESDEEMSQAWKGDDAAGDVGGNDDEAMTLRSTPPRPTARKATKTTKSKKAATAVVDDDSDEGATFKGFRGRKTRSKK